MFSVKLQHESAIGIHISPPFGTSLPPPSPSHPSRLIQSSCLSFLSHTANSWLVIYFTYGNVSFHVTLSIQLTLSSPLPMSVSLFSMSVSPLNPLFHSHASVWVLSFLCLHFLCSSIPSLIQSFISLNRPSSEPEGDHTVSPGGMKHLLRET